MALPFIKDKLFTWLLGAIVPQEGRYRAVAEDFVLCCMLKNKVNPVLIRLEFIS
jgi:hypothetical protein